MTWNIFSLIPLSSFIVYSLLLSIVIWQSSKTKPTQIFIFYLISMVIWSLGSFLMHADPPLGTPLIWNRFMVVGVAAMPILFYSFVRGFLGIRKQRIWLYLGVVLYIFLFTANIMGYFVKEAYVSEGIFYYEVGTVAYFGFMSWFLFVGLAVFNLIQRYRKAGDSFYRNRLRYLLIGVLIMAAGIATNFTKLGRYPLDILLNVINASLIAYVILRYKLLDINIIIRKGLVYFPLTGIIASLYLFTIFILERLLRGVLGISLVAILIAIGIAFVFQPLRYYLQRRIERLFFRERFDYYETLREFARRVVTILDLNELIDSTMNIVSETMQTDKVGVFLIDKDGFYLKGFTGLKESNLSQFKFKKDNPLVIWLDKNGKILTRDQISVFPEFKSLWKREIGDLEMLKAELFVPLKFKDNLMGIMVLGRKLSEGVYYEEDLALLSSMADQAAIAFENARLYEEIREALRKKEELEKKLRQQHEQLVRTERLRALGEMAGGVSHDFNNLLAIILGNAQLLERSLETYKPKEIKKRLKAIAQTAYDGGETVRRLQHFTRREVSTDEFTKVDLNEVVRSAISTTSPRWKDEAEAKGVTIKIKKELAKLPSLLGSRSELMEVLTNLIFNAVEAMSQGGEITIRTETKENKAYLYFSDTGPGIPKRIKGKIFDPFFTTKGPKASGLGLSTSYGIIKRHKGEIKVESTKGKGTTFAFSIPIPSEVPSKEEELKEPGKVSCREILVIDDEESVRDVLGRLLKDEGHRVFLAETSREGLAKFKNTDFDLVLTDLGMPEMSGWQLAKKIKKINPDMPVGMITGWAPAVSKERMKEEGVDFILTKPFDLTRVVREVNAVLRTGKR